MRLLSDFLTAPERAEARVRARAPLFAGIAAFLAAGAGIALADAALGRGTVLHGVLFGLAFACALRLVVGVVMTAAIHLSAELLGGEGKALSLFPLLGLCDLGWALLPPAALIARALGAGSWASLVLTPAVGLVVLALRARSVELHYGFSRARAWGAVGLPYLAAMLVFVLGFSLAVWGVVRQLLEVFA